MKSAEKKRKKIRWEKFQHLRFETFRQFAKDPSLSYHEKSGFPDIYREGREHAIFGDIRAKLKVLNAKGKKILEIGPGCGPLSELLAGWCGQQEHELHLVDSEEMLALLLDTPFLIKHVGCFPEVPSLLPKHRGSFDGILIYSVFHHVFEEADPWEFCDAAMSLLKSDGQMLLGDIPNRSKKKRFLASVKGRPVRGILKSEKRQASPGDLVILELLARGRKKGCETYLLPQDPRLPFANRREDILFVKN